MIFNVSKIAVLVESEGVKNTQGFYRRLNSFLLGGNANLFPEEKKVVKRIIKSETQKITSLL